MKHASLFLFSVSCLVALFASLAFAGAGEHRQSSSGHGEAAMESQHERMAQFRKAAGTISDGIILSSGKMVSEGAEIIEKSLEGHEKAIPHKNRSREKEFHGLFAELGKRTEKLKAAIRANDLPKSAVAFGRILETCAACHGKFRD